MLVTCGTREALFVALHVLLERGDEIVVTGPAPKLYRDVARLAGGRARVVAGDPAEGSPSTRAQIARRLTRRTRAIALVSPSSPAGAVADADRLDALADLAISRGLAVVSVETLEPFVYDGAVHRSIGSLPGMGERTVTINGVLRGVRPRGLAGRATWPGRESLLGPMTQLKQAMSICSPAVSQHAALAAVTGSPEPLASSACSRRRAPGPHLRRASGCGRSASRGPRPATTCSSIPGPPVRRTARSRRR